MADIDEIVEANSELLMEYINQLKVTDTNDPNVKDICSNYAVIFDKHIALMKVIEEGNKNDTLESIEADKIVHDEKMTEKRIEAEVKIASLKIESEERLNKEKISSAEKIEEEKRLSEAEINEKRHILDVDKFGFDKFKLKFDLIGQYSGVIATIAAPIVTEIIRQVVRKAIAQEVLIFEETGSISSTIGKAEFRK